MNFEKQRKEIDIIDQKMAELFEERMKVVEEIAKIKKENGLPIHDPIREDEIIKKNKEYISDEKYKVYYHDYMEMLMEISKVFQEEILDQ